MPDAVGGKKRKPPRLKLVGERSELEFHDAVVDLLGYALNGLPVEWTHFPAGGYVLGKHAAGRLKRLGLRPGHPDIYVWWKPEAVPPMIWGRCIGLELKTAAGGLSAAQKHRHAMLWQCGVPVMVCRHEEDVIACLDRYQVPHRTVHFGGRTLGVGQTQRSITPGDEAAPQSGAKDVA